MNIYATVFAHLLSVNKMYASIKNHRTTNCPIATVSVLNSKIWEEYLVYLQVALTAKTRSVCLTSWRTEKTCRLQTLKTSCKKPGRKWSLLRNGTDSRNVSEMGYTFRGIALILDICKNSISLDLIPRNHSSLIFMTIYIK